jgi:hypothetical protein
MFLSLCPCVSAEGLLHYLTKAHAGLDLDFLPLNALEQLDHRVRLIAGHRVLADSAAALQDALQFAQRGHNFGVATRTGVLTDDGSR